MSLLRVGIIGCGNIAKTHMEALLLCRDAEIAAVCDAVVERARSLARAICDSRGLLGLKSSTSDIIISDNWKDLISQGGLDAVHICTPHYLHAEIAIAAMKAGLHVLTEKPMAICTSDADDMVLVSEATGKRLGVCFQNRYNATSARMKQLVEAGTIGAVLGCRAFVTWKRDASYYEADKWRGTWKEEGGGLMINQAIHTLDLLHWLIGEPASVKGTIDTRLLSGVIEVEDTAEALIRFRSNSKNEPSVPATTGSESDAAIVNAFFYATNNYCIDAPTILDVVCELATLRLDETLIVKYNNGEVETVSENDAFKGGKTYWGNGHRLLIADWYNSILTAKPCLIDAKSAIPVHKTVFGLYESGKSGLELSLDL